jgi:hypothetical protein
MCDVCCVMDDVRLVTNDLSVLFLNSRLFILHATFVMKLQVSPASDPQSFLPRFYVASGVELSQLVQQVHSLHPLHPLLSHALLYYSKVLASQCAWSFELLHWLAMYWKRSWMQSRSLMQVTDGHAPFMRVAVLFTNWYCAMIGF